MNDQLQKFARDMLKVGLAKLPDGHKSIFKKMYSPKNLDADINDVVDKMPENRLDWAMQQVERSIEIQEGGSRAR